MATARKIVNEVRFIPETLLIVLSQRGYFSPRPEILDVFSPWDAQHTIFVPQLAFARHMPVSQLRTDRDKYIHFQQFAAHRSGMNQELNPAQQGKAHIQDGNFIRR
jgi:hypothetical protein